MRTLTWRPLELDGSLGALVKFTVTDEDDAVIEAHWVQINFMPPGPQRTAVVASLRNLLDLHALLDAHWVEDWAPPTNIAVFDERRNTSAVRPVPPGAAADAHEALARLRAAAGVPDNPQTNLFDPPLTAVEVPTLGRFHAGAGGTEVAAAVMAMPRTGTQRALILAAIAAAADGLIDEEIAQVPGVADTAHRTRRNELVDGGWITDSGRTRRTESGADSIIWVMSQAGRGEYADA